MSAYGGNDSRRQKAMPDGSHEGFARFFAETARALQRYVRGFVGSSAAADDIMQEAYTRTYQQGGDIEQPKAFLFVTARNLALNASRHQRVAATDTVADIDATGVRFDEGRSPEDALIADEEARLLQQAVQRLSPQCRAAFTMKLFQECSYRQIADELGISVKTVEKHISKGLRETHAFMARRYDLPAKGREPS